MTSLLELNRGMLTSHLQELLPGSHPDIAVVRGEAGWPTAQLPSPATGERVHLNSRIDPWGEADAWADSIMLGQSRVGFVYGCGFGYPLLAYVKRMPAEHQLFVFERDAALFLAMLSAIDMRALLGDRRVHWLIGEPEALKRQLAAYMGGDFLVRCAMMNTAFTPWAHRNDRAFYLSLHESLHGLLGLMLRSGGNSVHDTLVGLYNTVANAPAIAQAASLTSIKDAYQGRPAFIVGNGPSLDGNAEHLLRAQGKALILTAESALQPCLRRGIIPDAVCVTERTPQVYHIHFRDRELPQELAVAALTLVDPRVPPLFGRRWLPVFRSVETSGRWVQRALGERSALNGGSSSAHLAFELALWAGADPIVFVGMDLAFGENKATHSQLSDYTDGPLTEQVKQLQAEETLMVPGVHGQPVATTSLWQEFRVWLEHQISLYPGRRFIDATEGGARIEGTSLARLDETVGRWCEAETGPMLAERLAAAAPPGAGAAREALQQELAALCQRLQDWHSQAEDDKRTCSVVREACRIHGRHDGLVLPAFVGKLVARMDRAYVGYTTDEQLSIYLNPIIYAFQKRTVELGAIDTLAQLERLAAVQEEMFSYIQRLCGALQEQFGALAGKAGSDG